MTPQISTLTRRASALSALVGLASLFRLAAKRARRAMSWQPRSQQCDGRIDDAKPDPGTSAERSDPVALATMSEALTAVLVDLLSLYGKTKRLPLPVAAQRFSDRDVVLDENNESSRITTHAIGERIRRMSDSTLDWIGKIARLQRIVDEGGLVNARHVLANLCGENRLFVIMQLAANVRHAHSLCDEYVDGVSAPLIEKWIDEAEHNARFLDEATRADPDSKGERWTQQGSP